MVYAPSVARQRGRHAENPHAATLVNQLNALPLKGDLGSFDHGLRNTGFGMLVHSSSDELDPLDARNSNRSHRLER